MKILLEDFNAEIKKRRYIQINNLKWEFTWK